MSKKSSPKLSHGFHFAMCGMLFFVMAFVLLNLREPTTTGWILCGAVPVVLFLGVLIPGILLPGDKLILSIVQWLCGLGFLLLYILDPELARQQVVSYALGNIGLMVCAVAVCRTRSGRFPAVPLMALSLLLLVLPLLIGEEINGAKCRISLGSFSFQPSEIVKVLWVLILSRLMSERKHLVAFPFALCCLILLVLQKDLGTAFIYFAVLLLLYWMSSGNIILTAIGLAAGGVAAFLAFRGYPHVRERVALWLSPWADVSLAENPISQGLLSIARGGLFGAGLQTVPDLPARETDYIFAVLSHSFGLIVGICVLLLYAILILRGVRIAMEARRGSHGLLVMGSVSLIGVQTLLIVSGVLKLLPLTGVTMPFVSYGGSSLISSLCLVGLVVGVAALNRKDEGRDDR